MDKQFANELHIQLNLILNTNNNPWAKVVSGFIFANFANFFPLQKFSHVLYVAQEREGNFNNKMHNCYIASYYL